MHPDIKAYLSFLDLGVVIEDRVRELVRSFEFMCGGEVERIFLSDELTRHTVGLEDRHWRSLWGFSGPYWMEARSFFLQSDIDISPYWDSIKYLGITSEALNVPAPATLESRMSIEIETTQVSYSKITATGENCDALVEIVRELLLPNLIMEKIEAA